MRQLYKNAVRPFQSFFLRIAFFIGFLMFSIASGIFMKTRVSEGESAHFEFQIGAFRGVFVAYFLVALAACYAWAKISGKYGRYEFAEGRLSRKNMNSGI